LIAIVDQPTVKGTPGFFPSTFLAAIFAILGYKSSTYRI